jgi:hypothetical protein
LAHALDHLTKPIPLGVGRFHARVYAFDLMLAIGDPALELGDVALERRLEHLRCLVLVKAPGGTAAAMPLEITTRDGECALRVLEVDKPGAVVFGITQGIEQGAPAIGIHSRDIHVGLLFEIEMREVNLRHPDRHPGGKIMEMSDHERLTGIKAAAQACVIAGRTDLIVQAIDRAWWDGQAAAATWLVGFVEAERSPERAEPVARTAASRTAPAGGGSIFGQPNPQQRDALAAALKTRFESTYPKSAGQ